jgi:hypothetical protein
MWLLLKAQVLEIGPPNGTATVWPGKAPIDKPMADVLELVEKAILPHFDG